MTGLLYLVLFFFCTVLGISFVIGVFKFFSDLKHFKTELNFCGTRKQLIDMLIFDCKNDDNERGKIENDS